MPMVDFFNKLEYLEPRCPKCKSKLEYGVNTSFSNKHNTHLCDHCEHILE